MKPFLLLGTGKKFWGLSVSKSKKWAPPKSPLVCYFSWLLSCLVLTASSWESSLLDPVVPRIGLCSSSLEPIGLLVLVLHLALQEFLGRTWLVLLLPGNGNLQLRMISLSCLGWSGLSALLQETPVLLTPSLPWPIASSMVISCQAVFHSLNICLLKRLLEELS